MTMRKIAVLLATTLLVLSSCASDGDLEEETSEPRSACETSPPEELDEGSGASANVKRPTPGAYLYDICGLGGTPVQSGTRLTEKIGREGDIDSIEITTNVNDNVRRVLLRWEENRVVQLINGTVIRGVGRRCTYDPPLEILHIPMRAETFPEQQSDPTRCQGKINIAVLGRQGVRDATGRTWQTWVIELNGEKEAQTEQEKHWFSPDLGRDIRIEVSTERRDSVNQTAQLLRRYPGSP